MNMEMICVLSLAAGCSCHVVMTVTNDADNLRDQSVCQTDVKVSAKSVTKLWDRNMSAV